MRELHKRLLKAQSVAGGALYVSPPIKTDFVRYGTIHVRSSSNGVTGGALTAYGSNVYPVNVAGEAMDESELSKFAAVLGVPTVGGVIASLDMLAFWLAMGTPLPIPASPAALNGILTLSNWDMAWLILLAAPTGGSNIVLDAWLKMKSGGE